MPASGQVAIRPDLRRKLRQIQHRVRLAPDIVFGSLAFRTTRPVPLHGHFIAPIFTTNTQPHISGVASYFRRSIGQQLAGRMMLAPSV